MASRHVKSNPSRTERALIALDESPYGELWRIAVGYAIVPAWFGLGGSTQSEWTLIPFCLAALLSLRLVPLVVRKLWRFSGSVKTIWADRRWRAKHFDSFQWQKLIWIALGLTLYIIVSARFFAAIIALIVCFSISGAMGIVIWRNHIGRINQPSGSSSSPTEAITLTSLRRQA